MRMMSLRAVPKLDYATTEAINTLATNVIFSGAEYKTIMLTSCSANEGKSFVTFHLAEKLASLGYSVMLVDADLRKSVFVSRYDAVTQGPLLGMTHYLAGRCDLEDIQYRTNIENLSIIPIGKEVINSLPLLNSAGFAGMMKELRQRYHFVLVDAPPVGVIIDAAMIANICDGTLFVVTNEMVSKRELVSAVQQIQKSGCTVLGVILNIRMNPEVSINMKGFRPHGATIRLILSIGIPSVVMQSIGSVMTFLMNQILIAFSSTAVAVFGVYFKLQSFVFMPVFGLTNGTVPIVAYNFGARKGERMKKTIQYSVYAAIAIMICGALIFQAIPDKLLMLFDASDEMLRVGVPALRIISLGFPLAGFGIGAGAVFQALGFSVYSMIISLIRQLVVLIPCAYLIGRLTGDVTGVWWAFVVAEVVSLTVSALYLRRVNRNVIQTL